MRVTRTTCASCVPVALFVLEEMCQHNCVLRTPTLLQVQLCSQIACATLDTAAQTGVCSQLALLASGSMREGSLSAASALRTRIRNRGHDREARVCWLFIFVSRARHRLVTTSRESKPRKQRLSSSGQSRTTSRQFACSQRVSLYNMFSTECVLYRTCPLSLSPVPNDANFEAIAIILHALQIEFELGIE
jgi:hypothetical protein